MTKRSYEELRIENDEIFDLDKLHIERPVINGSIFSWLSWCVERTIGAPFRWYVSKFNLEPIEYETIQEEPTFYPFIPFNNVHKLEDENLEDYTFQTQYLEENTKKNPFFKSIIEYHKEFLAMTLTPLALVESIEELEKKSNADSPPLRIFTQKDWNLCKKAARESTQRYKDGHPLSVLDGIPTAIKDELAVENFTVSCGRAQQGRVRSSDSDIVRTLRNRGAIILGITNMHEMGMGVTGINPHHGTPRNPYNDEHVTGGSSSGSAVAVATGMLPFTIGTDGGGSVRIPSSFCGMHGIKPTFGRWSAVGCDYAPSTVTHAGVIATNTADLALVSALISHSVPNPRFFAPGIRNPVTLRCPKPFKELRFGTYHKYVSYSEAAISSVFEQLLTLIPGEIKDVPIGNLYLSKMAHMNTILVETAQNMELWREQSETLTPQTKMVFSICSRSSLRQYMQSAAQKTRAIKIFQSVFDQVDIFITPTIPRLPKKIDEGALEFGEFDEFNLTLTMWFVYLANLCGLPAVTINAGYSEKEGLPIGVQLMAPWWREDMLYEAAGALEQELREPKRQYKP